jgi:RNA polymerase sigma-70 factor (ECF subfamily)
LKRLGYDSRELSDVSHERMDVNLSDEQLVTMAVSGDRDAFGEIVSRWERKIFALCFGMLGREDDAGDAAQETFIAAYRNIANFRGEAKVSSWLHRIAVNQCLTTKRRQKTRSEDRIDDDNGAEERTFIAAPHFSPARTTERAERTILVRNAVGALPVDLRQVVVMKEFEEMTFQEISETLDLPLSTVKSRLYTALRQLKMKLERTPVEVV